MVESDGPIHAMTILLKIVTIMNYHQVVGGLSGEEVTKGRRIVNYKDHGQHMQQV
jgi:hypothetical protein